MNFTAIFNREHINIEDLIKVINNTFEIEQNNQWYWYIDNENMSLLENYYFFGHIKLIGAHGQELIIGKYLLEYDHLISWKSFLLDEKITKQLREFCSGLRHISPYAIYLPSEYDFVNYVLEGQTWKEVLKKLHNEFGDPVSAISAMFSQKNDYWYSHGYFIDEL
ncbi:hypothetical protein [Paenibacillus kyungheensis]